MSGAMNIDLSAASIIANIETYPRELVMTLARGLLPIPQEDLITVLAHLIDAGDAEVADVASGSLKEIPQRIQLDFATNPSAPATALNGLARVGTDPAVLEALIRNRSVSDDVVAMMARRATPALQEVIVINQARLIRSPHILDAILENPALTPDVRRRALETREEFFEKRERLKKHLPPEDEPVDLSPIADLLEKAEAEPEPAEVEAPLLSPVEEADEEKKNIWQALLTMTVGEKLQLAFKGDKTIRMILIRERNRLISTAVVRNPRMTDSEAEAVAGMRNLEEEVLRLVSMKREWMAKYPIVLNLVRNPKAPVGVVLPLINRLTLRDLKGLKDDKNVSEVVRTTARRLYLVRKPS